MDYRENKIQRIFNWVYLILCVHALWVAGLFLGLGIFGLIPSTITSFEIIREATDEYAAPRLNVFTFWWKQYKKNLQKHRLISLAYHAFMLVLIINYMYLSMQTSLFTLVLFYLTVFLFLFSLVSLFWFTFIASEYPHLSKKEMIQNAIALPMSRLIEMVVFFTLLISGLLVLWNMTPGLIVFTGMGIVILATSWVYRKIHDGFGIHLLFDSLKPSNKTI